MANEEEVLDNIEDGVLDNIRTRYASDTIYTYVGHILIAVNPFKDIPKLFNMHMMERFSTAAFDGLNPHVFAVAHDSYRGTMKEGRTHSILVSGDSGAGKTRTIEVILKYLNYVGGCGASVWIDKLLQLNPLLEAFGNARTITNDNSSRFGKYVIVHFDEDGRISGAEIRTYFLEQSRVVQITTPERNYHCFYQLCASKDADRFGLKQHNFRYLNEKNTSESDTISSAEDYDKTRKAMKVVGISNTDQESIFQTLAAILHLGNIEFSPAKDSKSLILKDANSQFHLKQAASLFKCDEDRLSKTLCKGSTEICEKVIVTALDCKEAVANRDALAKNVYTRLFDWLVKKINSSVEKNKESWAKIGILDSYGFECHENNSLEQFCINFANEKLQQHFNKHVVEIEQEEYRKENLEWSCMEYKDNQDLLDLIEKNPEGILALLDDTCKSSRSTKEAFSTNLFQSFKTHKRLEKAEFPEKSFTIHHYAGKVTYQTDSFLDKNQDYDGVEHTSLLSSSQCSFIAGLFCSEKSSELYNKFSSVTSRFKQQLESLMETLSSTEPHYIRCVKPNSSYCPQIFERKSVLHQLQCSGVLEVVHPTRMTYLQFVDRFRILAPRYVDRSSDKKIIAKNILKTLLPENFQLGTNRIFFKANQIAILDSQQADTAAKLIQQWIRKWLKITESQIKVKSYTLFKKLGAGRDGSVMKAKDETNNHYAVKMMVIDDNKPSQKQRFLSEGKTLKSLNHDNIVKCYTDFQESNKYYIVLEYVSRNLAWYLDKKDRPLEENTVRPIFKQLVEAVVYLHGQNLVHRDIKPANILMGPNNHLKLCDFGSSKFMLSDSSFLSTYEGTPAYMAPEILQRRSYGTSVDVWSCGVILFLLFTNELPWTFPQVRSWKSAEELLFPKLNVTIPSSVEDLLRRMLAFDPAKRISMQEVQDHEWLAQLKRTRGSSSCSETPALKRPKT